MSYKIIAQNVVHLLIAKYDNSITSLIENDIRKELNPYELNRVGNYRGQKKAQRIIGFELLRRQLTYFNQPLSLYNLKRSPFHQPYFESTPFQFSISYAEDYVVCLASVVTAIGVDIAFHDAKAVNRESDFLNPAEKEKLNLTNEADYFFFLHTRKEAISKALGLGIYIDCDTIDVQMNSLEYKKKSWFLNTVYDVPNYTISYATTIEKIRICISEI